MPGDKISVSASHQHKAATILRCLAESMAACLSAEGRVLRSVSVGSGDGKLEAASVPGYCLSGLASAPICCPATIIPDGFPRRTTRKGFVFSGLAA